MNITFRPAQASDVEAAIELIYLSGPSTFDYVFNTESNGSAIDFLRTAFLDGAGEFGYRNHIVAVESGRVLAVGAGWSGKSALAFLVAGARQIFRQYGLVCGLQVIVRGLRTEAVIPPPSASQFYLGHLGVVPALQGKGIGQRLIGHLLEQGRAAGFRLASLDVAVTNPRGQVLYERMGFSVLRERSSSLKNSFGSVANHRTMQMPLT